MQAWHLNLVAIFFTALVQPTGSLLLPPASQHPTFLSRLNPLIGMAEGVSSPFTLLALHFDSTNQLSYPVAATFTLYRREASSFTTTQLEGICSKESRNPDYNKIRQSLGFVPLNPRSISASTSLYVFGLLFFIRVSLNRWMYHNASLITMLCFHYIVSFGFFHLLILITTSRSLSPDEKLVVEEHFQAYLVMHQLQESLTPSTSTSPNSKYSGLDDSWRRVLIFITAYVVSSSAILILLNLIIERPPLRYLLKANNGPKWPLDLFPFEMMRYVLVFPLMLLICFGMMKVGYLKGNVGSWVHWGVSVGLVGSQLGILGMGTRFLLLEVFFKFVW